MTALELDGADGGGQLLRTALSLSVLRDQPFEMAAIRSNRPNPGLRPQHLACVEAVAALTDADVEGATEGSETLSFAPKHSPRGDVRVDITTAGSLTLLFDTVLPVAAGLSAPISVTATGGTDVKWAPPVDFLRRVKLPLLARYGLAADVSLDNRGFYPAGGGRATLHLAPSTLRPITLDERGELVASAHAVATTELGDDVCERALRQVPTRLSVPVVETTATRAESRSPGFALVVSLTGATRAGFDALGERGVPAQDVADDVLDAVEAWLGGAGTVDTHLADQLVVPLALAGGRVRAPERTPHLWTNCALVEQFGYDVRVDDDGDSVILSGET